MASEGDATAPKPRIAIFSGPMATVENTAPLVTSNKARIRYGLPPRPGAAVDALRPQRLASPVTVYVEQFSAHPLERDAADLYAAPDGFVDRAGVFHRERTGPDDVPVYEIELRPEDGLYPLPYAARQADGRAWEGDASDPFAPADRCRQPFYPDASRLVEEIDRLALGPDGLAGKLSARATFEFHRAAPSGGYRRGIAAAERTDAGAGDVAPERLGEDYFPYLPFHLLREPSRETLARLTNRVAAAFAAGGLAGGIWLDSSISIEETSYWLGLLVDTRLPLVAICSPDAPHGVVGGMGDRNLIDAVSYITSRVWADEAGADRIGAVVVNAGQILAARDALKTDARAGGIVARAGSGVVGNIARTERPVLAYLPLRRATHRSAVRIAVLPERVEGVRRAADGAVRHVTVTTRDPQGALVPEAMPAVTIVKHGRYVAPDEAAALAAQVATALERDPLAGLVAEGSTPYGRLAPAFEAPLREALASGLPVVFVGRGSPDGVVSPVTVPLGIAGGDLSATKARLLLMACLLRFGALPPAADPRRPTPAELAAIRARLAAYQEVFDTH